MKRKLNEDDVPEEAPSTAISKPNFTFDSFGLDARVLRGIQKEKFSTPTPVQSKAIPLALEGKDILGILQLIWSLHSQTNNMQLGPKQGQARPLHT